MKARVLIEPDRIRVSLPGYDVATASLEQMAFDSNFHLVGEFVSGQAIMTPSTNTTVSFGRTFDTAPIFLIGAHMGDSLSDEFLMAEFRNYTPAASGSRRTQGYINAEVDVDEAKLIPMLIYFQQEYSPYARFDDGMLVRWRALA